VTFFPNNKKCPARSRAKEVLTMRTISNQAGARNSLCDDERPRTDEALALFASLELASDEIWWTEDEKEQLPTSVNVRLRFLVEQIYRLGPCPLFHLLAELVAGAPPLPRIERYARLSREYGDFIRANGGDQFPLKFLIVKGND
jgi:hypothetical protein